ncbi:hypothetical protein ACLOJK_004512 [Asimina triloba]
MGGCATKPKDAILESLPRENPSSPRPQQQTTALDGDPAVANEKVDTGKDKPVENSSKEEPLVDLSDPKPDEPEHGGGEVKSEETKAISDLVYEIGGPKIEPSSNPVKITAVDQAEEKKTAEPAKVSEIPVTTPSAEEEKTQKPDVEAEKEQQPPKNNVEVEGASLKADPVETKDIKPEVSEQKQEEKA